jgi:hypothetical protein
MTVVDVLGSVDDLADGIGSPANAVTGAAIGPYRKSKMKCSRCLSVRIRSTKFRLSVSAVDATSP